MAVPTGFDHIGAALMDRLPAPWVVPTYPASQPTGEDMADLVAARARSVAVGTVPDAATEEVANHALALALSLGRRLLTFDAVMHAGRWGELPTVPSPDR